MSMNDNEVGFFRLSITWKDGKFNENKKTKAISNTKNCVHREKTDVDGKFRRLHWKSSKALSVCVQKSCSKRENSLLENGSWVIDFSLAVSSTDFFTLNRLWWKNISLEGNRVSSNYKQTRFFARKLSLVQCELSRMLLIGPWPSKVKYSKTELQSSNVWVIKKFVLMSTQFLEFIDRRKKKENDFGR